MQNLCTKSAYRPLQEVDSWHTNFYQIAIRSQQQQQAMNWKCEMWMRLMMQIFLKARKIVHKFAMTMDNVCNNSNNNNNKRKKCIRYAGGGDTSEGLWWRLLVWHLLQTNLHKTMHMCVSVWIIPSFFVARLPLDGPLYCKSCCVSAYVTMCELVHVAGTCCQLAGVHMYTCCTTTRHFILLCGQQNIAVEGRH